MVSIRRRFWKDSLLVAGWISAAPCLAQHEALRSPRLSTLEDALRDGSQLAVQDFWREVEKTGAPLIEPLEGDARHRLVTFLYRSTGKVDRVNLIGDVAGPDFYMSGLTRLMDTELWYKTVRLPADLRTEYQLSVNDPGEDVEDWRARAAKWIADPLNPKTIVDLRNEDDPEDFDQIWSVLELPDAPPQPWIAKRPGIAAGRLAAHRVRSIILGNERTVWVYLPPGYTAEGESYPLLVVFDGSDYVQVVPTPTILDNLMAERLIPPVVALFPDYIDWETRERELPCNRSFSQFLTDELIPWARARYHITSDPGRTTVAGASYGGLAAVCAALHRPDVFGNVLSQSGSFWWRPDSTESYEWVARQFESKPRLPVRFSMEVGVLETSPGRGDSPSQLAVNRRLRNVLNAKGYVVRYSEYGGGHDYSVWRGTFADGLVALNGGLAASGSHRPN